MELKQILKQLENVVELMGVDIFYTDNPEYDNNKMFMAVSKAYFIVFDKARDIKNNIKRVAICNDRTRDLSINILDKLIEKGVIPGVDYNRAVDCSKEFEIQDIIHNVINNEMGVNNDK